MADLLIVVGTYSGGLIGLQGPPNRLKTVFAFSSASACVKSLKIQDNFLIAGGFDEMLRVYEIEKKLELGSLLESQGSINAIDSTPTHVICGNDQGKVTIWRTKDWSLLHSMKGHKKAVTGLSLHPSQRMALSVGRDNRLYLWNLITGRPAFKHKLKTSVEEVAWSPCGEFFAISSFRNILYYNIHSNIKEEYTELKCDKQLTSICFIKEAKFIACSDIRGNIIIWNVQKNGQISFKAQTERIIKVAHVPYQISTGEARPLLVALTSAGELSVWNIAPVLSALETVTNSSSQLLENAEDLLISALSLKTRCSSLAGRQLNL